MREAAASAGLGQRQGFFPPGQQPHNNRLDFIVVLTVNLPAQNLFHQRGRRLDGFFAARAPRRQPHIHLAGPRAIANASALVM